MVYGIQPEKEQQLFNALTNYQLVKEVMGFRSKKKVMIFVKKEEPQKKP